MTPPGQGPKEEGAPSNQYRGVDSTRRGKAPPLAVFGDFLAAESHPSGASLPHWQVHRREKERGSSHNDMLPL